MTGLGKTQNSYWTRTNVFKNENLMFNQLN